jgi:ketosteroid isomerase-like protein
VRIFGDVAVIRGKAKVTVGGKDRQPQDLHIGYTDVWLWKNGGWKMTAWRSARLPDSPVK